MSEQEKFEKAVEDLNVASFRLRSVMNYLQETKVKSLSFTQVEEPKKSWFRWFSR